MTDSVYVVKEGYCGDGYGIRGIYTDYQKAQNRCEVLIEESCYKFYLADFDYWAALHSTAYITIRRYLLNEEIG
jgi:hypothetical protein